MVRRLGMLVTAIGALALPAHAAELRFPPGVDVVRLPAHVAQGRIIVRVGIGGRALDVLLDTGASTLVLDSAVAVQLHERSSGDALNALGGAIDAQRMTLPEVEVGPLRLRDAVTLSAPYAYAHDSGTRIVGLLGFDFFAGCVVRIDYPHGVVDAIRPEAFRPPAAARSIPVRFEDNVPLVTLSVNGSEGSRFVLDTGADLLTIFPRFAADHPDAVRGLSKDPEAAAAPDVSRAVGVGGATAPRPLLLDEARFEGERYRALHALLIPWIPLRLDGRGDVDGLLGSALLQRFVVYLDYGRERVYLEGASAG